MPVMAKMKDQVEIDLSLVRHFRSHLVVQFACRSAHVSTRASLNKGVTQVGVNGEGSRRGGALQLQHCRHSVVGPQQHAGHPPGGHLHVAPG